MSDEADQNINSGESAVPEETKNEPGLEEQLAACNKEKEEFLAGWQRARADFLNFKKEEIKRAEEIIKFGLEEIVKDLIAVLDSFDLAIHAQEQNNSPDKGIYMIKTQLLDILKRRGLETVAADPGNVFDPAIEEAVAETESDIPAGNVVEMIAIGYKLHGKVLRPVRVKVSKGRHQ